MVGVKGPLPSTSQAALHGQSEFIKRNGHLDHDKLHVGIGTEKNVQTSVNEAWGWPDSNHHATLGFNPGKVWKGENQWYQLFTCCHSSNSPLHPILSTPSSVVGNQQTLSVISTGPMFFLSKWPVSTQSPSLSFQAETFPPQSEKHVLQNGGFRNTNVTCTAQIETQWPKQSRASRTMGLCPASTKYLAQDRPRGDQWNQQGNKRNSSSIKVFCGLAFVWTPSSKIQVQYEGFLQIGRGVLDNLWIKLCEKKHVWSHPQLDCTSISTYFNHVQISRYFPTWKASTNDGHLRFKHAKPLKTSASDQGSLGSLVWRGSSLVRAMMWC